MKKITILLISIIIFTLSMLGIKMFNTKDAVLINKLEKIRYNFNNKKNYYLSSSIFINENKVLNNYDYFSILKDEEKIELFEKFTNTNLNYSLKAKTINLIKDINDSKFYLVNFKPVGYAVFKYETLEAVEVNYAKNLIINEEFIYSPFGNIKNNIINYGYNLDLNKSIETNIRILKNTTSFRSGVNTEDIVNINYKADIEVPYSWYFRYNKNKFPYNYSNEDDLKHPNGLCEYVALSLLMSYNELFVSSGYFNDSDIKRYFTINNGNTYEDIIPTLNVNIIRDLYNLNNKATNISAHNLRSLLSKFEKSRYDDYYTRFAYSFSADPYSVIVKGIPTMLSYMTDIKSGHNVVAYGYDTSKSMYLVHKGFYDETQVLYSRSIWNFLYDFSIRDNKKENVNLRKMFKVNGILLEGTKVNL